MEGKNEKFFFDKFVRAHFSQVPKDNFWREYSEQHVFKLMKKLGDLSPETILEIGCGTGYYFSAFAAFKQQPKLIVGVDISIESLKICKVRSKFTSLILCDCNYLPFKTETFDAVLMISVLHHVKDYKSTLNQSFKVLAVGGHELIVDLTSTNLLINISRNIWFILPKSIKGKIGDMQLSYNLPEKFEISRKDLLKHTQKIGAGVIEEDNYHLFVFIFYYLLKIFPRANQFFKLGLFLSTYSIERGLSKSAFRAFYHVVALILLKRKKSLEQLIF